MNQKDIKEVLQTLGALKQTISDLEKRLSLRPAPGEPEPAPAKKLTWKEALLLTFLRQFPYLKRQWVSILFFSGKGLQGPSKELKRGTAADKLMLRLQKAGLIRKVWISGKDFAYAISKKGKRLIEAPEFDMADYRDPRARVPLNFTFFKEQTFELLSEKKIPYHYTADHVRLMARTLKSLNRSDLLCGDLLTPASKKLLGIKSNPDILDLKSNVTFECEATQASPSRKYAKIKKLFLDKDRIRFFIFVFPDKGMLEAWVKDWQGFLWAKYTPVGKPKHWQEDYLSPGEQGFAGQQLLFTTLATVEEFRNPVADHFAPLAWWMQRGHAGSLHDKKEFDLTGQLPPKQPAQP